MAYDIIIGRNVSDKKNLGERGLTFIGKGYVKMGQYTSRSEERRVGKECRSRWSPYH